MILEREEYIEQAYFFRAYRERIEEGIPAQQVLSAIHEEILATTRLPWPSNSCAARLFITVD